MKLLLFDLDGTLVRSGGAGRKALNNAIYNLYGVNNDSSIYNLAGNTDLYNFSQAIKMAGKRAGRAKIERLRREYLRILPRYVCAAIRTNSYSLTPGIEKLLGAISKDKEILLALGTGNTQVGARIKLEPTGFNKYFLFGGFGDDSFYRSVVLKKAYWRAARRVNGSRISPSDVYVVGDTVMDVEAGKSAGFKTVAVGTGYGKWEELVRAKPDYMARDFNQIEEWFSWIKAK